MPVENLHLMENADRPIRRDAKDRTLEILPTADALTLGKAGGIFGVDGDGNGMPFWPQLKGVLVCGAAAFISAYIIFTILKYPIGIRVSEQHEREGLDSHEHGIRGYTITYDQ